MVRVLSDDPNHTVEVPVLHGVAVALHLLKELRVPLAVAVRAAVVDSQLLLMPSEAQRMMSELDFLAVFTRAGLVVLRAQAQDTPHAVLVGAADRVQAGLMPVYEVVQAMSDSLGAVASQAPQINVMSGELDQVASSVEKAVQAASQFSVASARRMALRSISSQCASRLQTLGQRVEPGQIDRALQRVARTSVRQRLLAGKGRADGRSASDPGSMALLLQPPVNGKRSVLIHSGRSHTCITAAPGISIGHSDGNVGNDAWLRDVFLRFHPTGRAQIEDSPQAVDDPQWWADVKRDFFPFVSMALEPVMQPRVRVAAYAAPAASDGLEAPDSAMTGVGGGCLAMLSAGAPIKTWVAGADLGLLAHGEDCLVLADPLLSEEALLDAHLKLAGTCHGLTAVELVAKTPGISLRLLEAALAQGVDMCRDRLVEMRAALADLPCSTEPTAPHLQTMHIDPALTHEIMVRRRAAIVDLCEAIGASVRIGAQGLVSITAPSGKLLEMACRQFKSIAGDALKNGATVDAVVVEVIEFFGVKLATKDGKVALLHTSRMTPSALRQGMDLGDTITIRLLGQDVLGSYRAEMPIEPESASDVPLVSV